MTTRYPIAEKWVSYRQDTIPVDASDEQIKETRRAFYAGAASVIGIILIDDPPPVNALMLELRDFLKRLMEGGV